MVRAFFFFLIVVFLNPLAGIAEKVSQEDEFLEVIKPENDNSEEKLLEIIRSLANEGEPNAQAELGVRYLIGNGVSKNSAEAFKSPAGIFPAACGVNHSREQQFRH